MSDLAREIRVRVLRDVELIRQLLDWGSLEHAAAWRAVVDDYDANRAGRDRYDLAAWVETGLWPSSDAAVSK